MDAREFRSFTPTLEKTLEKTLAQENSPDFLQALLQLLALKDKDTLHHSDRVYTLTLDWSHYMKARWQWTELHLDILATAALLHDIGKIAILDEVLRKAEALSISERNQMEQHSEIGYQLIRDYPGISDIALAVRHHHERWDGKGYPLGLKGKMIPLFSQIIAIVDAYDAITSDRPYRSSRSSTEALEEILNEAGRQFNPDLVASFLQFMHARNT